MVKFMIFSKMAIYNFSRNLPHQTCLETSAFPPWVARSKNALPQIFVAAAAPYIYFQPFLGIVTNGTESVGEGPSMTKGCAPFLNLRCVRFLDRWSGLLRREIFIGNSDIFSAAFFAVRGAWSCFFWFKPHWADFTCCADWYSIVRSFPPPSALDPWESPPSGTIHFFIIKSWFCLEQVPVDLW